MVNSGPGIRSNLPRRSLVATMVAAALLLSGLGAATASAAPQWVQGTTTMSWSASNVSVSLNGGAPVDCSLGWAWGSPEPAFLKMGASANGYGGVNNGAGPYGLATELSCEEGTWFTFCACVQATKETSSGVFSMSMAGRYTDLYKESPFGTYIQSNAVGVFTNGTGPSNPSTLKFNKTKIGALNSGNLPVELTGTFYVMEEEEEPGVGPLLSLKG